MKLLTNEIKNKLPKIRSTEPLALKDKTIVCKFFNPCGAGTWYIIEGEQEADDFLLWCLVDLHEMEFGYVSLNELESITLPFDLKIERDLYFSPCKVGDVWEG